MFIREKIKSGEVKKKINELDYGSCEEFGFIKRGDVYYERMCEMDKPKHLITSIKNEYEIKKSTTREMIKSRSVVSQADPDQTFILSERTHREEHNIFIKYAKIITEHTISNDDIDIDIIKEKVEDFIEITDWKKDLFNYYLKSHDFCDKRAKTESHKEGKPIFALIFKMYTLWRTLARESKKHRYRIKELFTQAKEFHGQFNYNIADGVVRTRAMKKDSINCKFYFHYFFKLSHSYHNSNLLLYQ